MTNYSTPPTDDQVAAAFLAHTTERAESGGGVVIAKAVAGVTFDNGEVRIVLDPALAGAEYWAMMDTSEYRNNLADFFGSPVAFEDEVGIWLRTRVQIVSVRDIDGRPLGSRTTEELTATTRGE